MRMNDSQAPAIFDVVVVGGGAAGLSGALTLARARRSVLVIDAGEPRNAPAAGVHGFLTRDGMAPAELLNAGRAEVRGYGGIVRSGQVTSAARGDDGFVVTLDDASSVRTRRLLVATGLTDELPDIPGIREHWGHDVLHCPYCHGWEVRDQAIGILGTGPMATHGALLFRQWSSDVILFQHTSPPLTEEQAEQLEARGIIVVAGEVVGLETRDDRLAGVRLRSGEVIPRRAVVVTPQMASNAKILAALELGPTELEMAGHVLGTFVASETTGATAVEGVWVAGNVTDPIAQVVTAAGAGMWAGAQINADLIAEETRRAVAAFRTRSLATR